MSRKSCAQIGGQEMELKVVTNQDKEFVMNIDKHIDDTGYENRVQTKCSYVIWNENQRIGIMSHCFLWDKIPFLNLLFIEEKYRGKGFAKQAVLCWEAKMKQQGYQMTLISTQADEGAQHLYRKLFTFSFVFAVTKCANEIEEFRCRFWEGKPVIYDKINTSFTYLDDGSELFKVVNVEMQDTIEEYVSLAAKTVREQTEYFTGPMENDIYQFSSFPWVSFTHISHTESGKKDNATPMIDWGKFFIRDEKVMLPFSVQVHHSFVDGVHIGKLAKLLQDYLNCFT